MMKLNVKRLFARSMTGGLDLVGPELPSPRSAKRKAMFITLAGILAVVGTLAGVYYFEMRPVILRIAVGPANSDDIKVVQALTQAFTHAHSHVRLRPMQTDGATASAQALADGKADLAIIRGDLDVPKNAQAVATLRKNVAVLWVPDLPLPALSFGSSAPSGTAGAAIGYPGDGPLTVSPARVRGTVTAIGQDIYNKGRVVRQVYALRVQVHPGNSGGPFVGTDGSVLGVVFAASREDPDTGYALTAHQVVDAAQSGQDSTVDVATGHCT
jgi:hypothetical protein